MKTKTIHVCSSCGATASQWRGQCPGCGQWNTLAARTGAVSGRKAAAAAPSRAPEMLSATSYAELAPLSTGMAEFDRVLGGGLIPGAAVLVGGEPGIGKSTILLQLAGNLAAAGLRAVYVSGEESLPQLASRARRLGALDPGPLALSGTEAALAAELMQGPTPPDLLILDSVQTMTSASAEGLPGSVSQVRAVAGELVELAKRSGTALVLVGHVTKDGQIAGPKLLEHMVDAVLSMEGDRSHLYRLVRVLKNRFGPSDEILVLEMHGRGLTVVADPSTFFLGARDSGVSGSALVLAMEGKRPLAVEVQALVGRSYLSIPRRTALGLDVNRLHLLLAVLEKRLGVNFGQSDVYAKIGGGLRPLDPGLDLGVAAALLSSFYDRPLPDGAVFWGEIDLSGRIRPAPGHPSRLKQAGRLGYKPLFHAPEAGTRGGLADLKSFARALFGKGE
ncbi:MAG: DNA repair protein RadA [Desulfovibrionaceae bacterium]|nr:DNA repair protein RadA [Desulfovibrionaceae bacterium]MBF0513933.1 DNA repair protein RadA [Desulfovibrionaceae bacterium]